MPTTTEEPAVTEERPNSNVQEPEPVVEPSTEEAEVPHEAKPTGLEEKAGAIAESQALFEEGTALRYGSEPYTKPQPAE